MDNKNGILMKFAPNFFANWCRVHHMAHESVLRLFFQTVFFPLAIAYVLFKTFIDRGYPQDTFGQFVFFSTIYLFWVGITQTWQAVNGAVESGEWNYWVLGIRRERRSYLKALLTYYVVRTLLVALVYVFSVAVFYHWFPWGWAYALVAPYCEREAVMGGVISSEVIVEAFCSADGAELLPGMRLNTGFLWCWFVSFGLGLWMAAISGVCVGLACSTITRKSRTSVFLAVSILMIMMANSFVSQRATRSESIDEPWREAFETGASTYLPVYFAWHDRAHDRVAGYRQLKCGLSGVNWTVQTVRNRFSTLCEKLSFFSPQRYFFNVAHLCVPRLGYLSRGKRDGLDKLQGFNKCACGKLQHLKNCGCVFCLGIAPLRPFLRLRNVCFANGNGERFDFYTDWLSPACITDLDVEADVAENGDLVIGDDMKVLRCIWLKTALVEICVWLALCATILFLFVMLPIRYRSYLNTFR